MDDVKSGRPGQRERTRTAILLAARDLLADGRTPSAGEIATAAGVSRRTLYMHFTSVEHLLADAALEASRELVEPEFEPAEDAHERLDGLVRAMQRNSGATEDLGRIVMRHTLDPRPREETGARRGYRRIEWIERALEPVRPDMSAKEFERLVSALTLVVGWEAMIVLRDIRGLTPKQAEEVSAWAAQVLLEASVASSSGAR